MFDNLGNKWAKKEKKGEGEDDWVTTFADMATLLLAFFVLLAAISKVDPVLFEQVKAGMAKGIGNREIETPIQALRTDITSAVEMMQLDDSVSIGMDQQGMVIEFASAAFYDPDQAELRPAAIPAFQRIANTLEAPKYHNFQIEVQGHTDDTPVNSDRFPSNWELSSARASGVVRLFVEEGLEPERMKAIGFADTAPKVPNTGPDGTPLPNNREINRRVTVRVSPR